MAAFRAVRPAGGSPERFSIVRFAPVPSQRTGMAADGRNRPSWRRDGAQCAARGRAADSGGAGAASIRRNRARRAAAADACPPVEGFSGRSRGCGPFARAAQAASCLAGKYSGSDRGGRTSPAEPAPATGAGTREAAASARLQASACRICAIRPRPAVRTAGNCRRPRLFALGRTPPYPRFQHSRLQPAGIRCDRTCGLPRRGRKPRNEDGAVRKRGGCPTNLGPPPSSVPPAIREFSRRGGSRRVEITGRTASARRPERSTPRGCSPRPRPARRPEALRAIWLRRRTPPRLRADRA